MFYVFTFLCAYLNTEAVTLMHLCGSRLEYFTFFTETDLLHSP